VSLQASDEEIIMPLQAIRGKHKVTLPAEALRNSEKQELEHQVAKDLKGHMAVLLASLVLPTLHFASCGITSLSSWSRSSWQLGDLIHVAWFLELLAVSLLGLRAVVRHGALKHWAGVVWSDLVQKVGIVSLPISWGLAFLYFDAILQPQVAAAQQDIVMVVFILFWALSLTLNLASNFLGLSHEDCDDMDCLDQFM